jgi:DNA polymerase-1
LISNEAGDILWATLLQVGISRSQVALTSIVSCLPMPETKAPSTAIEACRERVYNVIRAVRPKKILLLGSTSTKAVFNQAVTKIRGLGSILRLDDLDIFVVATYSPAAILHDQDLFRDFADDVEKWASQTKPMGPPKLVVQIPTTVEEALDLLPVFVSASSVSCDIETTGLDCFRDQILSVGFGTMIDDSPDETVNLILTYEILEDPEIDSAIKWFLSDYPGDVVFHNIKFDMKFLRMRYGIDLTPHRPWDTLLMRYAQDERGSESTGGGRSYGSLGLKDIARVRYDIPDYHFDFNEFYATPFEERDWEKFFRYQAIDTHTTIRLFHDLYRELESESKSLIPLVQNLLVAGALTFAKAEMRGTPVDIEYLRDLRGRTMGIVEEKIDVLREIAKNQTLNPNSPKQVKEAFISMGVDYKSGERIVLQMMLKNASLPDEAKEFIPALLDYRQREKILKTYIDGLLNRLGPDNRIHPDFKMSGTDTGRLSCRNPNLQNIPTIMGPEIKRAFVAPEGWLIVNADYSQLELRVTAFLSRDPNLIKAYTEGIDVHRWVASFVFDKPMEEITSFERYMAKYVDFGIIYGRSSRGLCEGFEAEYIFEMTGKYPTIEWADGIQEKLFNGFPTLKAFIDSQHTFVRKHQYVETITGRRRRFPYMDRRSIGSTERKAVNTPIQGSASDMALSAAIRLDKSLDPERGYMISSVHDSLMFLLREDYLEEGTSIIRREMETPVIPEFDIPLRVDIGYGTSWDQAKE